MVAGEGSTTSVHEKIVALTMHSEIYEMKSVYIVICFIATVAIMRTP